VFARPILHVLCACRIAARVLLHRPCEGEPARFAAISGRFAKPVVPGEQLTVQVWSDGGHRRRFRSLGSAGDAVIEYGVVTTT
jgi:acyl dehydratase